eukprot:TRINITY_DN32271_c0_g1_i1.p1 TRINITY_DN32271_c0_g1~~TRINITY_DN32271_c0_g1_i1.p1  ORF type:complete len:139 (-),score=26.80 TRINITY_DN32271_c0_g1_i1:89-451(-)
MATVAAGGGSQEASPSARKEEVDALAREAIAGVLGDRGYVEAEADTWADQILERTLRGIASLGRPYKYIATCVISKQAGQAAALDTAATAFWDTQSDSLCCTRRGNGRVDCIVTIYACRQ